MSRSLRSPMSPQEDGEDESAQAFRLAAPIGEDEPDGTPPAQPEVIPTPLLVESTSNEKSNPGNRRGRFHRSSPG